MLFPLSKKLSQNPRFFRAHQYLIEAYSKNNNYCEALRICDYLIKHRFQLAYVYAFQGELRRKLGNYKGAIKSYKQAIVELKANSVTDYDELQSFYYCELNSLYCFLALEQRNPSYLRKAEKYYKQAIQLNLRAISNTINPDTVYRLWEKLNDCDRMLSSLPTPSLFQLSSEVKQAIPLPLCMLNTLLISILPLIMRPLRIEKIKEKEMTLIFPLHQSVRTHIRWLTS